MRSAKLRGIRGRINLLETGTPQLMDRLASQIANAEAANQCRTVSVDFGQLCVSGSRPSPAEMAIDQIGRNEAAKRLMVVLAPMVFDGP